MQIPSNPLPDVPEVARIPGAELRTIALDGVGWRYWFAGSGPPLLLIHGFMGFSFSWRFNVAHLAQHFSVYAIDLPGCGFSQRSDLRQRTIGEDAEAVLAFMDHFGIERTDIIASSRGGGVTIVLAGLLAASDRLHRMRRVVLVSPINPWSKYGQLLTRILATAAGGWLAVHILPRLHFLMTRYLKRLYGDPGRISPGTVEGYRSGLEVPGSFQHLERIVRSWAGDLKQIGESLPALIRVPALLLWGSLDRAVYPESAEELHRRLPGSSLHIMDGVGHLPYEEVPGEFNRVVCDFLLSDARASTPQAGMGAEMETDKIPARP